MVRRVELPATCTAQVDHGLRHAFVATAHGYVAQCASHFVVFDDAGAIVETVDADPEAKLATAQLGVRSEGGGGLDNIA